MKKVLDFQPFAETKPQILAGVSSLSGEVRWVHCSEMSEAARLFQGGELLLTQGRGIGRSTTLQTKWIDDLADAGVAGIAIEIGVVWPEIPRAVVDQATKRSVPLIALKHPAYFMKMTRAVHSSIISSHYDALRHAEELGRRLSRLAMAGADLQAAMNELSSAMGYPLVLSDRAHQVEAYAPRNESTLDMIRNWQAHARQGHDYSGQESAPMHAKSVDLPCLYQPILYQGELWGCVHVLLDKQDPDELTLMAMDRAVMSIGLAYAVAERERRLDGGARSELIQDLLSSHVVSTQELENRAQIFGADLSGSLRVFMVQPREPSNQQGNSSSNKRLRAVLSTAASAAERLLGTKALIGYSGTRVAGIAGSEVSLEPLGTIRCGADFEIVVGISGPADIKSLVRAGQEASETVRYATESGGMPGVYYAERLGLERLFLKLDEGPLLVEHIARELGSILDHDAATSSPLLPTLEAYLLNPSKKAEVARSLFIERRTLYHRLDRIRSLLGADLDHPDRQLALKIAVRGLMFREKRASHTFPSHSEN